MEKGKNTFILTLLCAFGAFLCAHGFGITNLLFSGESLRLAVSESAASEIAAGDWLQVFYFRIRGRISAPYLVGILSGVFLLLTCFLILRLFEIKPLRNRMLICCALLLNPAVTALLASGIQSADAVCLAALLGTGGAYVFFRHPKGWLVSTIFFGLSFALSFDTAAFGPVLLVMALCQRKRGLTGLIKWTFCLLGAALLFTAGLVVLSHRYGCAIELSPLKSFSFTLFLRPIQTYFEGHTAYPHLAFIGGCFLLLFLPFSVKDPRHQLPSFLLAAMVSLLLAGLPSFLSGRSSQVSLTDTLFALLVLVPVLSSDFKISVVSSSRIASWLCVPLFLGQIIFANQIYLKKNLEFQSTLSVMTRVLDRLESTEGFRPGQTKVTFYGSIEKGPLSVPHEGFERLSSFEAAAGNFSVTEEELNTDYFWQILGYPVNALSDFERETLRKQMDLSILKPFPDKDCLEWVNDVLVVKLSD